MTTTNPTLNIISKYLDRHPSINEYHMLKSQVRNIQRIMAFNTDIFIVLVKKNKKRFFSDIETSSSEIKDRILSYFYKQQQTFIIGKLFTIIELQSVLVATYTDIMGILTIQAPDIVSSKISYDFTSVEELAMDMLNSMNVATVDKSKVMGRHNVSSLVKNVNKLMEEYLRRHNKSCICYGSYSLHLLNPKINYGDIDILQTNSRTFLIDLAFLIKFITGNNIILSKIPYLRNYMVVKDENDSHIIDSFNIRQDTMSIVPKIYIDNIYIVDPTFQLLNMLKMFSQLDRLEDLAKDINKFSSRLSTMLGYVKYTHGIVFDGKRNNMPMKCTINQKKRIVTVFTKDYFSFKKCLVYLDENVLSSDILDLNADTAYDFESLTNSVYLVHNDTMYTYFSNTILLSDTNKVHEITARGLCAHILLYQMLTGGEYLQALSDLLNSLMNRDRVPIYSHTDRDKKPGRHGFINIEKDMIVF
ncbi:VP55 [Murmansk poxvirus]|uniref:Poly(A) polymerase catalytic subunit n=1 Tax=Murmansk poxvirus TaxID=2025359 RepID=A0A223FMP0_9POXV|nr:VP55 [Murmansk poxvirus]AST09248.1 VP55 [Murmansk poxvirus]